MSSSVFQVPAAGKSILPLCTIICIVFSGFPDTKLGTMAQGIREQFEELTLKREFTAFHSGELDSIKRLPITLITEEGDSVNQILLHNM